MVIRDLLSKLSSYRKGINLKKFKDVSKRCVEDPSNSHNILKKEFLREVREVAIRKAREEKKENWNDMALEDKEGEIAKQEERLWQIVKTGGSTALGVIFGINLSS